MTYAQRANFIPNEIDPPWFPTGKHALQEIVEFGYWRMHRQLQFFGTAWCLSRVHYSRQKENTCDRKGEPNKVHTIHHFAPDKSDSIMHLCTDIVPKRSYSTRASAV